MAEDLTEDLVTIKLEVGEDLLLGEGENPQTEIEIVTGTETTGSGMKNKPQVQVQGIDHTEAVRDGRSPGETIKQRTLKDNLEIKETTGWGIREIKGVGQGIKKQ